MATDAAGAWGGRRESRRGPGEVMDSGPPQRRGCTLRDGSRGWSEGVAGGSGRSPEREHGDRVGGVLAQIRVELGEQTSEKLHILGGPASKHVMEDLAPLGAGALQYIPASRRNRQQGGSSIGGVRGAVDQPRSLQRGDLPADRGHVKHERGGQLT